MYVTYTYTSQCFTVKTRNVDNKAGEINTVFYLHYTAKLETALP